MKSGKTASFDAAVTRIENEIQLLCVACLDGPPQQGYAASGQEGRSVQEVCESFATHPHVASIIQTVMGSTGEATGIVVGAATMTPDEVCSDLIAGNGGFVSGAPQAGDVGGER